MVFVVAGFPRLLHSVPSQGGSGLWRGLKDIVATIVLGCGKLQLLKFSRRDTEQRKGEERKKVRETKKRNVDRIDKKIKNHRESSKSEWPELEQSGVEKNIDKQGGDE